MSDEPRPADAAEAADGEEARRRARRRAAVFGDVLPESTRDDRDPDRGESQSREDELKRNVPPHHG